MAAIHASGAPGGVKRPSYRFLNASVIVRFDHVASLIVNANQSIVCADEKLTAFLELDRRHQRSAVSSGDWLGVFGGIMRGAEKMKRNIRLIANHPTVVRPRRNVE